MDVDGWRMRNVTEVKTGTIYQEEEYAGMHPMTEVQSEKYLGDILSHDGKNEKKHNLQDKQRNWNCHPNNDQIGRYQLWKILF